MKTIDIIVISILVLIVSSIIYFSVIKKKDNPCKGCPYANKCRKSISRKNINKHKQTNKRIT